MALVDKNLYFDTDFQFELIGSNVKKFIIFSIKKTDYQSIYTQDNHNTFETFLLIKAQPNIPIEKNIVFTRERIHSHKQQKSSPEAIFLKSESLYCTFLRHVDLLYCKKLAQTLQILNIHTQVLIENQWFMLYEVHSYKPVVESLIKYELKSPVYGGRVVISNEFDSKNTKIVATVSNLFRLGQQNIYFVNDTLEPQLIKDMNLVISSENTQVYGLTYKIKDQIICIPLNMILFEKPSETIIDKNLFNKLEKTCYVQYLGSYCTGILVDEHKIITARHLFPKHQQKIGNKVIVKLFPFHENTVGIVIKIGLENLDIMQIQLLGKQVDLRMKKNQKLKLKQFVKQELVGNLVEQSGQKQNTIGRFKFKPNFMKNLFRTTHITPKKKYLLGDQITALGFGKLTFNINIFNKFDIAFPTVAIGVVSKIISIKNFDVFLKTDAKLYSGFSGCGIWKQEMVGMAVFILKNKTTNSHHNRHNFSYTAEFIEELRKTQKSQLMVEFNGEIDQFDRIQTRHELNLIDLPHAKL